MKNSKDKIIGVLFSAWFIGSIIGIIFAAIQENMPLFMILFGQAFAFFGIAACVKGRGNKKSKKTTSRFLLGIVFTVISVAILTFGLINKFGSDYMKSKSIFYLPLAGTLLFAIVGLILIITSIRKIQYAKKHITYELPATVVSFKKHVTHVNGHNRIAYAPVWSYYYQGTKYEKQHPVFMSPCPYKVAETATIRINPDAPEEIYGDSKTQTTVIILGAIFLIAGVLATLLFLTNI